MNTIVFQITNNSIAYYECGCSKQKKDHIRIRLKIILTLCEVRKRTFGGMNNEEKLWGRWSVVRERP